MERLARGLDALAGAIADGEPMEALGRRAVALCDDIQELQAEYYDPENPLDVIPLPGEVRTAVERWLGLCEPLLAQATNLPDGRTLQFSFDELRDLIAADDELRIEVPAPKWLARKARGVGAS